MWRDWARSRSHDFNPPYKDHWNFGRVIWGWCSARWQFGCSSDCKVKAAPPYAYRTRGRIRAIFPERFPVQQEFKVGERVIVQLSGGRLVDAEIKAIIETTQGTRLQVSFGETARIYLWQVVEKLR
jgi:hypothetical protein